MLSTDKTTTWKSATLPEKFLQRTFSFEKRKSTKSDRVERRSPLDNRAESRSGRNNGLSCQEQEASSTAIEKSLRTTLLEKTVKNSRIRRAMSCKGHSTLQQQKTVSIFCYYFARLEGSTSGALKYPRFRPGHQNEILLIFYHASPLKFDYIVSPFGFHQ